MTPRRPGAWLRRALQVPGRLYEVHAGWLLGRRFLRLTHVGRITGRRHHTMLEVIGQHTQPREVIVIAGLGRSAQWYLNVRAGKAVEVAIGRDRFFPAYRELDVSEAEQVLADYERRNRWAAWLIRGALTWLVGWTYDGTDERRRRLARELPMVAFRPA